MDLIADRSINVDSPSIVLFSYDELGILSENLVLDGTKGGTRLVLLIKCVFPL